MGKGGRENSPPPSIHCFVCGREADEGQSPSLFLDVIDQGAINEGRGEFSSSNIALLNCRNQGRGQQRKKRTIFVPQSATLSAAATVTVTVDRKYNVTSLLWVSVVAVGDSELKVKYVRYVKLKSSRMQKIKLYVRIDTLPAIFPGSVDVHSYS